MAWMDRTVSVVFPARNEEPSIARAVSEFRAFAFLGNPVVDEVIVVDNNSGDRTAALAREAGARVVPEPVAGFGAALIRGLRTSATDLVVLCEPDSTFRAGDLPKLLVYMEDFDLVIGTRTTKELIWENANMGWLLRAGNVAVAKLLQVLFNGPSLSDCGCTYRCLNRKAVDAVLPALSVTGSHFLVDLTISAIKRRLRLLEIPVNYRPRVGTSKITGTWGGVLRTAAAMVRLMLKRRFLERP